MVRFVGLASAHGVGAGSPVLVTWRFVLACFAGVLVANTIPMCPAIISVVPLGLGSSLTLVSERRIFFFGFIKLLLKFGE